MYRSPLTEQYQRVMSLVEQLHALAEDERNFILDLLVPLPEQVETRKATKKSARKSNKSASKSARGQSLSNAIQRTAKVKIDSNDDDGSDPSQLPRHCFATVDDNGGEMTCGKPEDDPVHDMRYLSSHPFARDSRAAQPARGRSSTNGGAGSGTQNIETEREGVGVAVGGSNE